MSSAFSWITTLVPPAWNSEVAPSLARVTFWIVLLKAPLPFAPTVRGCKPKPAELSQQVHIKALLRIARAVLGRLDICALATFAHPRGATHPARDAGRAFGE